MGLLAESDWKWLVYVICTCQLTASLRLMDALLASQPELTNQFPVQELKFSESCCFLGKTEQSKIKLSLPSFKEQR